MPELPEVQIEIAKEVTPDLVEAMQRLVPHLGSVNQVEITPDYVRQIIAASSNSLIVSRDDERKITGMGVLVTAPTLVNPRAFLETLVVDPSTRRQGVAKSIVQEALVIAKEKGVNTLRVNTGTGNDAANELFQNLGGLREEGYNWYDFVLSVGPQE